MKDNDKESFGVWITPSDYKTKIKRNRINSGAKKTKLPTQLKSKTHTCSLCKLFAIRKIQVSDIEFRWLCKKHFEQWNRQHFSFKPKFQKADELTDF